MRHYQPKPRDRSASVQPIMARVVIRGERFVFLKWPEGQWLAECNACDDLTLIPEVRGK